MQNSNEEPKKELYGWVDPSNGMDGEGGWTLEGGEDAYYEALTNYQLKTMNHGNKDTD